MGIDIVKTTLLIAQRREHIELMDDYGTTQHVYIPVSLSATRQQIIDQHVQDMQTHQAAIEAYAAAHGHDVSLEKAAGVAKKQALLGQGTPLTSTSTATATTTTVSDNTTTATK